MKECKPKAISSAAFAFCRYGISVIVWAGYVLRMPELIILSFLLLALSALLKIERAPMIYLYTQTIDQIVPSSKVILDEHAMRFAHTLGSLLLLICIMLIYAAPSIGWVVVLVTALIKTVGALGYCSGVKLYACMNSGTCCRFLKKTNV